MSKVVHFEIPADDTNRAKEFWSSIFGIEWQNYDGPVEYYMFQNDDQQSGGGPHAAEDGQNGLTVYFAVEDLDAAREKVQQLGRLGGARRAPCRAWAGSPTPSDTEGNSLLDVAERRERAGAGRRRATSEPRRIEELELGRAPAEDRLRDELAACEPEHVAVARVAAGDPDAVAARHAADERQRSSGGPEDPGPAVRDRAAARRPARPTKARARLDRRGRHLLVGGELGLER